MRSYRQCGMKKRRCKSSLDFAWNFTFWKSWLFQNFQCSTCSRKSWIGCRQFIFFFSPDSSPTFKIRTESIQNQPFERIQILQTVPHQHWHLPSNYRSSTSPILCWNWPPICPKVFEVQKSCWCPKKSDCFLGIPESLDAMTSFTWDAARIGYPKAVQVAFREKLQVNLPLKDVETSNITGLSLRLRRFSSSLQLMVSSPLPLCTSWES